MWCSSCRADVAAELSTDNRRMLCARCQSELGVVASAPAETLTAPRALETERDARELLARWSTQNLLDSTHSASSSVPKRTGADGFKGDRTQIRFDPPRMTTPAPAGPFGTSANEAAGFPVAETRNSPIEEKPSTLERGAARNGSEVPVVEPPVVPVPVHETPIASHDREQDQDRIVRDAVQKQLNRRLGWSNLTGQLFAYGGVGLLTCGTVLVVWSYFGGPPQYMPTGLLTAAVGQMLLFLGVITLISSGMEQTVHEVSWRIDHLAEEVYHMGLSLDGLERHHRDLRNSSLGTARAADDGPQRKAA